VDWFERLTGFRETGYDETRRRLAVEGSRLRSLANGKSYGIGALELVSLRTLRERAADSDRLAGRITVRIVSGDVGRLHLLPEFGGALFQVASQFNLLEMTSFEVTPEHGVTRYENDPTQGPACAIACGAATIFRNYFAPVGGGVGQTRDRQLDGLHDLGEALGSALGVPAGALWTVRNGYALCRETGLNAIARLLDSLDDAALDVLRGLLRIGIHRDVEVTAGEGAAPPTVSQAFCSALPVAYTSIPAARWKAFASLVLEAAYEATLCAAVASALRGGSPVVLLTRLGGGAFGNDDEWIDAAMRRALRRMRAVALDVRLVSYGAPSPALRRLAAEFE
jgi:hypothetical protein